MKATKFALPVLAIAIAMSFGYAHKASSDAASQIGWYLTDQGECWPCIVPDDCGPYTGIRCHCTLNFRPAHVDESCFLQLYKPI